VKLPNTLDSYTYINIHSFKIKCHRSLYSLVRLSETSVADGDGSGVVGQCSVLFPSFHLGGDYYHKLVEWPVRDDMHPTASEVQLEGVRHDQLHCAVRGAAGRHDGAILHHSRDPVAEQSRIGSSPPERHV